VAPAKAVSATSAARMADGIFMDIVSPDFVNRRGDAD
jgi:hypothetical protein